jgi:hypothetical protein
VKEIRLEAVQKAEMRADDLLHRAKPTIRVALPWGTETIDAGNIPPEYLAKY